MAKRIIIYFTILSIGVSLIFNDQVLACFNPTDSFATEVLLNKPGIFYNLKFISQAENVRLSGDFNKEDSPRIVDYRSHYNSDIAIRLSVDSGKNQSLSVRIQIPTKFDEEKTDLTSAIEGVDPETFNWSEAMKTELLWLKDNGVILGELTKADIDQISSLSKKERAGHNLRIVYEDGKWLPYNQTSNPLLARGILDCSGFPIEILPSGILTSLPKPPNMVFAEPCTECYRIDFDRLGSFLLENQWIFLLIILWTLPWKGIALWKSARLNDKWWFIALLVINTLGLLEILYIFVFSKRRKT